MAAPALLCLAPLENGKFCQLKKRPCHFHGAYWAAQEHEAGGEENDSEGSNSDTDSVSSIATNSIDSTMRCGAETGKGTACKQPGRPCHLHKLWWKTHKVPFTSPKHAAKPSSSSTGWYVQEEVDEWTEVGESPVGGSGAVAALSPASSSGSGSTSLTYMHSGEMRTTGQRLYHEHFSQPYTDKKTCSHDWQLEVPGGTVQRPNHGLAHSVRVACALPLALRLLLQARKEKISSVLQRDVNVAQYMLMFAVVGRGNEISHGDATSLQQRQIHAGQPDAPHMYDQFKEKGKEILRGYFNRLPPASLQLSKKEQAEWIEALDIGSPAVGDLFGEAMKLAHDADLMRCYNLVEFDERGRDEAIDMLGEKGADTLLHYVRSLNEATGDRCWGLEPVRRGYNKALFARCSRSYDDLLAAIDSVPQPLVHLAFAQQDDDDNASVSSSSSGLDSLIEAFHHRLQIKGTDDVSVYEQLQFKHSQVITTFRKTPSCVRCFYADNHLNHDIIMNGYTSPKLFERLNLALCQKVKDTFIKMYSLLLCKALTDGEHGNIPSIVWRGVGYSDALLRLYAKHLGKVIYIYSFTSTSRLKAKAQEFARRKATPALLKIHVAEEHKAAMADVEKQSAYPIEREILMMANMGFRIDAVDVHQREVELTIVDTSKCGSGALPNRYCGECKKIVDDEKWAAK